MADFDDLWDDNMGIDIDTLNTNINSEKANQILDKEQRANIRKTDDWLDDENSSKKDSASQWYDLISHIEKNFNIKRDKLSNSYSYKLDKLNGDLDNTEDPKKLKSLTKQLKQLQIDFNIKQRDLLWDAVELNFLKGRASGFIPNPKNWKSAQLYNFYDSRPDIVEKELASGKYKYNPTDYEIQLNNNTEEA